MARRGLALADRVSALRLARDSGEGRLDPALLARVDEVLAHAEQRAALSSEHTVVALAGATGSGKSSLFNALVGRDLATVDVRRPTTAYPQAYVRGQDAPELLDWLEVGRRAVDAHPDEDAGRAAGDGGLVLLDLPDHDSVVTENRERAERLVERADLLVWVLDPQKYADSAVHERYLRPLADHADVMVLVLNQIDRLSREDAEACLRDLRRLAREDGLGDVPVLGVSARTGQGLPALEALLDDAVRRREAANARTTAGVRGVAREVVAACGPDPGERGTRQAQARLTDALERAAGVDTVVDAVRVSSARRARAATGWPPTRWLGRLRRDPLRRLRLGAGTGAERPELTRTSLPQAPATVAAAARTAVRDYTRDVTAGAPEAWQLAARERTADAAARLPDALDRAVSSTRLVQERTPRWWAVAGALQWVLLAVVVAGLVWLGLVWLGLVALLGYLQLPRPGLPQWHEIPWPTLMVVGGVVAGLLVALVARLAGAVGARRRARRARAALRRSVASVADTVVRLPVAEELAALTTCRRAARIAAS